VTYDMRPSRLEKKTAGMRRAIVETRNGVRLLSCSHRVKSPNGGKSKDAQFALCRECLVVEQRVYSRGTQDA